MLIKSSTPRHQQSTPTSTGTPNPPFNPARIATPSSNFHIPFKHRNLYKHKYNHNNNNKAKQPKTQRSNSGCKYQQDQCQCEEIGGREGRKAANFDPKQQLKSRIIRAILNNSDTIQKQIDYKKSLSIFLTPIKTKNSKYHVFSSIKKYANRKKPQKFQPQPQSKNIHIEEDQSQFLNSARYNQSLEIGKIIKSGSVEGRRLSLNSTSINLNTNHMYLRKRTQSQSQKTDRSVKSSYARRQGSTNCTKILYFDSPFSKSQREANQIKPWAIGQSINQKQFQFL